jgi:hypothetical protein
LKAMALLVVILSVLVSGTASAQVGTVAPAVFLAAAGLVSTDATVHIGKLAPTVFLAAAAFDWTSTSVNLATGPSAREANPELAWLNGRWSPDAIIALGATQDVVGLWLWSHFTGRQHPRAVKAGLYLAAGLRVAVAARNVSRYRHVVLGR